MKIPQKKKMTRNYQMLTKVESGKCRRVTAATDGICLNTGRMHKCTNRKTTLSRPENVYWDNVVFFPQMMVIQKEKLRQSFFFFFFFFLTTTTSLFHSLNIQVSHHLQIARLIEAGGVRTA